MEGGIERGTGDRGRVKEEERGGRQGVGVKREGRRAEGGREGAFRGKRIPPVHSPISHLLNVATFSKLNLSPLYKKKFK